MNIKECEVLKILYENSSLKQREISKKLNYSLGTVNKIINKLTEFGYINQNRTITDIGEKFIENKKPKNAIILAAGYGLRMIPINNTLPKGLLQIHNETIIERIIKQLHEVNIKDITIVVGYMKEMYDFLIDKYNVKLVYNKDYKEKNNLYSLELVKNEISNTYIIPSDVWCEKNPFNKIELYPWYMVNFIKDYESNIIASKSMNLRKTSKNMIGNRMLGICYTDFLTSKILINNINKLCENNLNFNLYWEESAFVEKNMLFYAKLVDEKYYIEINTYEQLRELDNNSNSLNSDALNIIKEVFNVDTLSINNIKALKKGMTNRSFTFEIGNNKYIMRIPGEGTDQLINREYEYNVYNVLKEYDICDDIIYINYKNGYKITKFIDNVRVCDPYDERDLKKCMKVLKNFHQKKISVDHKFDIFEQINFYEYLWGNNKSIYCDYYETKKNILSLKSFIEKNKCKYVLTHIDAVPDNFLIYNNRNGDECIKIIDWEYAGMQDPHVDIAMFCIYSLYEKQQIDKLIDIYFDNKCSLDTRIKIYSYIAICGLLWSNWCEYKRQCGVEFGEYSLKQYRYAKDFYKIVNKYIEGDLCIK